MGIFKISALVAILISSAASQPSQESVQNFLNGLTSFSNIYSDRLRQGSAELINTRRSPITSYPAPGDPVFGLGALGPLAGILADVLGVSRPINEGISGIGFAPGDPKDTAPLVGNSYVIPNALVGGFSNGFAHGLVNGGNNYNSEAQDFYDVPEDRTDFFPSLNNLLKGIPQVLLGALKVNLLGVGDVLKALQSGSKGISGSASSLDPNNPSTTGLSNEAATPFVEIGRAFFNRGPDLGNALSKPIASPLINLLGSIDPRLPYIFALLLSAFYQPTSLFFNIIGNSRTAAVNRVRDAALADPDNGKSFEALPTYQANYVNPPLPQWFKNLATSAWLK